MDGSPQKKDIVAPQQQQIDADVMGAMQGKKQPAPDVSKNLDQLRRALASAGITPEAMVRLGELAQVAIQDKAMFPVAAQAAVKEGLIKPEMIPQGIDYKMLAQIAVAGRAAQELVGAK